MHVLAHLEHRFHAVTSIARRVLKVAADVAARTEATPGAGNNDGSHFVVVPRIRERGDDLVDHDFGVSVELGGAIQGYRGDSILFRVDDLVKIHVNSIKNRTYRTNWTYHLPVNFGSRFSMKARTPSLWSSVIEQRM